MNQQNKMQLDDLTIKEAREIAAMFQQQKPADHHYEIGKCYLFRLATVYDTGRIVAVTEHEIIIEDAAWIPDTGRFSDALKSCKFGEVEPFPAGRVIIGRGAIVDACQIESAPRSQK